MMTLDQLQNTLRGTPWYATTENGARGFSTTGRALLDLNFAASSLRNLPEDEIFRRFTVAFDEDPRAALLWLFFCRDCRGGMGERRTFRAILARLTADWLELVRAFVPLVPEYGRADDLLPLLDTPARNAVVAYVRARLAQDMEGLAQGASVSLLAKWLPSCGASSDETRRHARILARALGLREAQYRRTLSQLRRHLDVVEQRMSRGDWGEIDYEHVPSRAAVIYRRAFARHDEVRYQAYQDALTRGEAKICSAANFPHDIVHAYTERSGWSLAPKALDPTLEAAWKALPNYVQDRGGGTLCVVDGSGSMQATIGGTTLTALETANALGLYFAERLQGPFHDAFVTFSDRPQLVNLARAKTLRDRLRICYAHDECANTDIEATFDLILRTAVQAHLPQAELPSTVLVLSDMEFDAGCDLGNGDRTTLFEGIARRFANAGYKMPRLAFWNLCSRTETIPVRENELGVALVSGFSPAIAQMVLSNEVDPYRALLRQLEAPRYAPVAEALTKVFG